jgi:hypothetical protein
MRRELERIEIPGEHDARTRAWETVQSAYAEREPVPPARPFVRPLLVAAAAACLVAAALTPPGRAVVERVREAVGVEGAEQAILSLPTSGRILVNADSGPWIVAADGSRRFLGRYDQATWSPRGLYVGVTRGRELLALTPRGDKRWAHARPGLVELPRWSPSGFRIAYFEGSSFRVIAGDGTGDRLLVRRAPRLAPAWRPVQRHVLAVPVAPAVVAVFDVDGRRRLWTARIAGRLHELSWSADGSRLLALHEGGYTLLTASGRVLARRDLGGAIAQTAAFAPTGRQFALIVGRPGRSEVRVGNRLVFTGAGAFNALEWSPDGRWLLVSWGTADQWVFIRSAGVRRIAAVSNVARQFESEHAPDLAGWCCP